jgi:hypothetical protein
MVARVRRGCLGIDTGRFAHTVSDLGRQHSIADGFHFVSMAQNSA